MKNTLRLIVIFLAIGGCIDSLISQAFWVPFGYIKTYNTIEAENYSAKFTSSYMPFPFVTEALGDYGNHMIDISGFGGLLIPFRKTKGALKNETEGTGYTFGGFFRVRFYLRIYKSLFSGIGMELYGVEVTKPQSTLRFMHSLLSLSLGYRQWLFRDNIYWASFINYGAVTTGDNQFPTKGRGVEFANRFYFFLSKKIAILFGLNVFPRTAYYNGGTKYQINTIQYQIGLTWVKGKK